MHHREPRDDDDPTLTFAQQAALDAFPEAQTEFGPRTVRTSAAPCKPAETLDVEMGSPGLLELATYLYSHDDGRSQYSLPPAFVVWWARAKRGLPSACCDSPTVFRNLVTTGPQYTVDIGLCDLPLADPLTLEPARLVLKRLDAYAAVLVRWAKWFDCIVEHTGFQHWYSGELCPEDLRGLSGFRLLMAWINLVPGAADQCRRALAQAYDWDPTRRLIGYAPFRGVLCGDSGPDVFDAATALLLQQRILDAQAYGSCISDAEHEAACQSFRRLFGIDVENAWILPSLQHIEQARLALLNADVRQVTLTLAQLDRFENQRLPSPRECAAHIIAATKADVRASHPSAAVPPLFDITCVLDVMERYSFSHGGGSRGSCSRLGWARRLNRLARAAKAGDRPGASVRS